MYNVLACHLTARRFPCRSHYYLPLYKVGITPYVSLSANQFNGTNCFFFCDQTNIYYKPVAFCPLHCLRVANPILIIFTARILLLQTSVCLLLFSQE